MTHAEVVARIKAELARCGPRSAPTTMRQRYLDLLRLALETAEAHQPSYESLDFARVEAFAATLPPVEAR